MGYEACLQSCWHWSVLNARAPQSAAAEEHVGLVQSALLGRVGVPGLICPAWRKDTIFLTLTKLCLRRKATFLYFTRQHLWRRGSNPVGALHRFLHRSPQPSAGPRPLHGRQAPQGPLPTQSIEDYWMEETGFVDKVPEMLRNITGAEDISGKFSSVSYPHPVFAKLLERLRLKTRYLMAEAKRFAVVGDILHLFLLYILLQLKGSLDFWNDILTTELHKSKCVCNLLSVLNFISSSKKFHVRGYKNLSRLS